MCSVNCFLKIRLLQNESKGLKPGCLSSVSGRSLQFHWGPEASAFWFREQVCDLPSQG